MQRQSAKIKQVSFCPFRSGVSGEISADALGAKPTKAALCRDLLRGFLSFADDIPLFIFNGLLDRSGVATRRIVQWIVAHRGPRPTATIKPPLRGARWQRIPAVFLRIWAAKKGNSCHAQEVVGNDELCRDATTRERVAG